MRSLRSFTNSRLVHWMYVALLWGSLSIVAQGQEVNRSLPREDAPRELVAKSDKLKAGDLKTVEIAGVVTRFHWCPPGEFMMGSPESEKGRSHRETQHLVKLSHGFWLCEVPVTIAAYEKFVNDTGYETGIGKIKAPRFPNSHPPRNDFYIKTFTWKSPGFVYTGGDYSFTQEATHPVVCVSWDDAQRYIEWVNEKYAPRGMKFKLPSEAEWEYACRANRQTVYWWGNDAEGAKGKANVRDARAKKEMKEMFSGQTTFSFDDGYTFTSPVGCFQANDWGLKDMTGNVWEWCEDWFGDYITDSETDPSGPQSGSYRVRRGGGWSDAPLSCRSAHRLWYPQSSRLDDLGFRLELIDISK